MELHTIYILWLYTVHTIQYYLHSHNMLLFLFKASQNCVLIRALLFRSGCRPLLSVKYTPEKIVVVFKNMILDLHGSNQT